jgi:hypothetical protein
MNKKLSLTLAGFLMIAGTAIAQETFTGVWVVTTHVPNVETEDLTWTVTEMDGKYTMMGAGGDQTMNALLGAPISTEIDFDGMKFTIRTVFKPSPQDMEFVIVNSGVIDGDTFEGTSSFGGLGEYRLTGVRR